MMGLRFMFITVVIMGNGVMSCLSFPPIYTKKSHFKDQIELSNLKPGVYKFELRVTDTSDQTDTAQVTVLVLTPEQSESEYTASELLKVLTSRTPEELQQPS